MKALRRIIFWLSSLKVAIALLFLIAIASGIGTAIPQGESIDSYLEVYGEKPFFGFVDGSIIIHLQLDHVYSSTWFLGLLAWLGISLMICSWRRQFPILKTALSWIDYKEPKQLSKLAIAETIQTVKPSQGITKLADYLQRTGWQVKQNDGRLAARKGVIGRIGPPLIHFGLILLMFGAALGALKGQKVEKFLAPGRSFDLLNQQGLNQLTLKLNNFYIERDPVGRPEQFRSQLELIIPGENDGEIREISVNHPLRFKGLTIYQADWSLAAITLQIGKSPKLQLPLQSFPQLGEQIWGLVLPTNSDGTNPILISMSNETGPVQIFDENGDLINSLTPGGDVKEIKGVPLRIIGIVPASGVLLKRDPGVPIVYTGFAIILIGGALSMISTRQLWAISELNGQFVHLAGLSNRNLLELANEIPQFSKVIIQSVN